MGNQVSFEVQIEAYESQLLRISGVNSVSTEYVEFELRGTPVRIRTIKIHQEKPTLVIIHGYASAGPLLYPIFKPLSEHFSLVVID